MFNRIIHYRNTLINTLIDIFAESAFLFDTTVCGHISASKKDSGIISNLRLMVFRMRPANSLAGRMLISQCGENEEIRLQREAFQRLFDYLGDHLETYQLLLANDRNNTFNKKLTATVEQQVAVAIKHMSKKPGPSQESWSCLLHICHRSIKHPYKMVHQI